MQGGERGQGDVDKVGEKLENVGVLLTQGKDIAASENSFQQGNLDLVISVQFS